METTGQKPTDPLRECKCGTKAYTEEEMQELFYPHKSGKHGYNSICKDCVKKNSAKQKPEDKRKDSLRRNYGITPEDYNVLLREQNSCCAICGRHETEFARRLHIDHCHDTNIIRGLLCVNCNVGIGKLGDTVEALAKAIIYISNGLKKGQNND